jgi:hypothetical protein
LNLLFKVLDGLIYATCGKKLLRRGGGRGREGKNREQQLYPDPLHRLLNHLHASAVGQRLGVD